MEFDENVPSWILTNLAHIIKALSRYLHRSLHPLQALVEEIITADLVPHFLLQLLSDVRQALNCWKLGACRLTGIWQELSIFFPFDYVRNKQHKNQDDDENAGDSPLPYPLPVPARSLSRGIQGIGLALRQQRIVQRLQLHVERVF